MPDLVQVLLSVQWLRLVEVLALIDLLVLSRHEVDQVGHLLKLEVSLV